MLQLWAVLILVPAAAVAQEAAGAALWRLAATTVAVPPALATGATAAFWNPAQINAGLRLAFGLELVETPSEVGAGGPLVAGRVRARPLGSLGLVYGRMEVRDLVRTEDSPAPLEGNVPYYSQMLGFHWSRALGNVQLGAMVARHETRLDAAVTRRWTLDVGVRTRLAGEAIEVAGATHFWSPFDAGDAKQDVYLGLAWRPWRGALWEDSGPAALWVRYGAAVAHGFAADHVLSAGMEIGHVFAADLAVVREGGYASGGWRPVGGVRVGLGRYRLTFASNSGTNDLGSAYRVGLEARVP